MNIPEPWEAILLALAAFRCWRLFALDDITEPLRMRLLPRLPKKIETWWLCPWCAGSWWAAAWWAAWEAWPRTMILASVVAVMTAVGLLAKLED